MVVILIFMPMLTVGEVGPEQCGCTLYKLSFYRQAAVVVPCTVVDGFKYKLHMVSCCYLTSHGAS